MQLKSLALAGVCLAPLVTASSHIQTLQTRNESSASIDDFLRSVNIAPDAVSSEAKAQRGVALACTILEAAYPAALVNATDGALYVNETEAHNSQTAWERPRCIFTPPDAEGVSLAVRTATEAESQFAVRSGGHSPLPGFASIGNGGFLISLSGITDLHYDAETETQRSGFGNLWGDVYGYLAQFNRIIVGGRSSTVGLALTLGGGLSHASNEYGWACQNIVSYELVLADGCIVTASADEREDLFAALKAGQNNFGVVTHVVQKTYPAGRVWGGIVVYPGSAWEQFMSAMAEYQANGQLDTKSAMLPYFFFNTDIIIQQFVYYDGVERPEAFAPFYNITSMEDQTQIWDSFSAMISAPLGYSLTRYSYATTTMYLDEETYIGATEVVRSFADRAQPFANGELIIMPQPISSSMISASNAQSPDPFGTTDRPQMWYAVVMGWLNQEDDEQAEALMMEVLEAVETYTRSRDMYDPFIFTNDAYSSQAPLESYGAERFSALLSAQERYDPTRVFQRLVPGGFKLS